MAKQNEETKFMTKFEMPLEEQKVKYIIYTKFSKKGFQYLGGQKVITYKCGECAAVIVSVLEHTAFHNKLAPEGVTYQPKDSEFMVGMKKAKQVSVSLKN